jgi:N-acetyl-alpha-D-muramate 1-phosphate uridylyltransferase
MPDGSAPHPGKAMVLAAGLGKRMRPVTATTPKPLVRVGGRSLIDHSLDRLADAGISEAVVNVHYLADLVEAHVRKRIRPAIRISDERAALLDTGGGIKQALPLLGAGPILVMNSDSLWIEGPRTNLGRLLAAWAPERMDILLLLAATATSIGYDGIGDFRMDSAGLLARRSERQVAPFVYTGVGIVKPSLFADTPDGRFSLNVLFDRAIERGRLYGLRLDGRWLHVGTPEAIRMAEDEIAASAQ